MNKTKRYDRRRCLSIVTASPPTTREEDAGSWLLTEVTVWLRVLVKAFGGVSYVKR